jgi:hypothetical protein
MSRFWKTSAIALVALLTLAPTASARGRGRGFAGLRGGAAFYGGGFYPGFYGPGWWYGGWYGPWWGPSYRIGPQVGEVKIVTKRKGDSIYIDGGYAGVTGKLKSIPLRAGTHTIELRNAGGHTLHQQRVYVIAGKTLKLHPDTSG